MSDVKEPSGQQDAAADNEMPSYISHRLSLWDSLYESYQKELSAKAAAKENIKITLPDGTVKEGVAWETTPYDIASSISKGLADSAVVAKVNGECRDMTRAFEGDSQLELLKFDSEDGKHTFWHSSAHVLGQAMEMEYKGALCIGPPVENGFYYDMALDNVNVKPEDFGKLEKRVTQIVKEKQAFQRLELKKEDALELFKYNKYKTEIINQRVPDGEKCTAYRCGPLIDLCRGPHLPTTSKVKTFSVLKNSSAYWRADANNDSLQRIYAISFPDKKMMKEFKVFQAEAAKRDHRVIGNQQKLFFMHPWSPGCPFFLPHGARIHKTLFNYIRKQYWKRGFEEVITPNFYNMDLFKTSGHADKYGDDMFYIEVEKQKFGAKPMNCPAHCLMFKHAKRSFRELPIRLADFGVLHRNELAGALTGLTRVRRFQQDDAHIFCTTDQVGDEIAGALGFLQDVYGTFGFTFELELSTRPETNYLGEIAVWDRAEEGLKTALTAFCGDKWELNPGDGAFYGPKIDIKVFDALKRQHQCATIQLDFNLPQRFNLQYMAGGGDDKLQRPVMIHRAILGSVERFMAVLIEHNGGKWPFWLSPRQVKICPVSEKFKEYAAKVHDAIHEAGYYVETDHSDRKLPKKIREAQLEQHNFILVVGQEEMDNNSVNVRTRDNKVHGAKSVEELLVWFKELVDSNQ